LGVTGATPTAINNAKPPYVNAQALGGVPSRNPDIPASSISLFLFFLGALIHFFLFKHNKGKGRLFPMNVAIGSKSESNTLYKPASTDTCY